MRLIGTAVTIGLLSLAGWWAWHHYLQIGQFVETHISSQDLVTLEVRYTPEQIVEAHHDTLLPDEEHSIRKPQLLFYPYLLLEVTNHF